MHHDVRVSWIVASRQRILEAPERERRVEYDDRKDWSVVVLDIAGVLCLTSFHSGFGEKGKVTLDLIDVFISASHNY